jgi:hypothetical protein
VNEVPRRQFTGRSCARDVVAEIEDVIEVVFEGELEDVAEPGLEIESAVADARCSRRIADCSIPQYIFMAAPQFSAAAFKNRGIKIACGLVEKNK